MIHTQGASYNGEEEVSETPVKMPESVTIWRFTIPRTVLLVGACAVALLTCILAASIVRAVRNRDTPQNENHVDDSYWMALETQLQPQQPTFTYSVEEREQLRAWGYTGDEIEAHALLKTRVQELIAASRQLQEDALATLSNPESPEYQALLDMTWLGQDLISLPSYESGVTEQSLLYTTCTVNADYEKVPAHGHTLYLKVYLDDGSYTFMECPVLRYLTLADVGNIVVRYTAIQIGDGYIVSDMEEVVIP